MDDKFHKKYLNPTYFILLLCLPLSTRLLKLCTFFEQTFWPSFCWMHGQIKVNSDWEVEFYFQKNRITLRVIFYKT